MAILITAVQSLCATGLVFGVALSLYQAMRSTETRGVE